MSVLVGRVGDVSLMMIASIPSSDWPAAGYLGRLLMIYCIIFHGVFAQQFCRLNITFTRAPEGTKRGLQGVSASLRGVVITKADPES